MSKESLIKEFIDFLQTGPQENLSNQRIQRSLDNQCLRFSHLSEYEAGNKLSILRDFFFDMDSYVSEMKETGLSEEEIATDIENFEAASLLIWERNLGHA